MGVGVEGDVGEAEPVADEEGAAGEMLVHQPERGLARLALAGKQGALEVVQPLLADESQPEAQGRDVGLVIILLPIQVIEVSPEHFEAG